jgi:hypothetical protein
VNTRLLLAAAGTGSFTAPWTITTITTAPASGWTQITNGQAVSGGNGKTYVGYVRGDNGDLAVRSVDETTGTPGTEQVLHAAFEVDIHSAPTLLVRDSDHKLLVWYSKHLGSNMYMRVSTNSVDSDPTLSGGFAAATDIDSSLGGTHYTYPSAFQMLGEASDPIYLFYRDHQSGDTVAAWAYSKSTDGGSTWSAQTSFLRGAGAKGPYLVFDTDGDTRIDIAASDGHPIGDAPTSVYHFYLEGGTFKTSTDATISASQPFLASEGTLVYSGSESGWPVNISPHGGGPLAFTYQVLLTGGTDCSNRYARWTGTSWTTASIVNAGGVIESTVGPQARLDRNAPNTVYAPVKVGSHFEMQEWKTTDAGLTWAKIRDLTTGSSVEHLHPQAPRNAGLHLRAVWLVGTYTDYLNYSLGIEGLVG